MYKPIEQNEFVFATLVTICLITTSPYLALVAVLAYMIFRSRLF